MILFSEVSMYFEEGLLVYPFSEVVFISLSELKQKRKVESGGYEQCSGISGIDCLGLLFLCNVGMLCQNYYILISSFLFAK